MSFLSRHPFQGSLLILSSFLSTISLGQVLVDRTADYFVYNTDATLVNVGLSIAQGPAITSYTTRAQGGGTTSWFDVTADTGIEVDWRAASVLGSTYTGGVYTSANNETVVYTAGEYISVHKLYRDNINQWKQRTILNNRTLLPPLYSNSNNPIIDSLTGQALSNTNLFLPNNKQTITIVASSVCSNDEIVVAAQINDGTVTGSIVTATKLLPSSSPLCKLVPCITDTGDLSNTSNVWVTYQAWYSTTQNYGRGLSCSSDGNYLVIGSPDTNEVTVYNKKSTIETLLSTVSVTVSTISTLSYIIGLIHNLASLSDPWIPIARLPIPRLDTTPPNAIIYGSIGLGGWGFGYSTVILNNGIVVVGAPNAGPFTYNETTRYQLINTGAINGGALYVFDLLSSVNSTRETLQTFTPHSGGDFTFFKRTGTVNLQRSLLPSTGTAMDPFFDYKLICRFAGPYANGNLGMSVSASMSTFGHQLIVWGGIPKSNRVAALHISPITRLASVEGYITGFRITTERDIGISVSYRDEMGFFGSPSASNLAIVSTARSGRLYVKAWCQRDRTIAWPPSYSAPHVRTCTVCPDGRTSKGTDLLFTDYSIACDACSNTNQRPLNSRWISGAGCLWKCSTGYFGNSCLQCSNYMNTPDSALTNPNPLPVNAAWVNDPLIYSTLLSQGITECVWRCNPGFRINQTIVSTVPGFIQYGIRLGSNVSIESACVPPAPPDTVLPVTILGVDGDVFYGNDINKGYGITSSSVYVALFVPAVEEPLAPVNIFRTELEFNRTLPLSNEVWDITTMYSTVQVYSNNYFDSPSDGTIVIDIPFSNSSDSSSITNGTIDVTMVSSTDQLVNRLRWGIMNDLLWPLENVTNITLQPIILRIRRLLASTDYRLRIAAGNVGGFGLPSVPSPRFPQSLSRSFITSDPVAPSSPGSPTLVQSSGTSLLLQWDEPFDNGGTLQQSIEVCLCKGTGLDNQGVPNSRVCGFATNGGSGLCDITVYRSMNTSLYPLNIGTPGGIDYGYGTNHPPVSRTDVYNLINDYIEKISVASPTLRRNNSTTVVQSMENSINFQFAALPKDASKGNSRQVLIRGLPSSTTYYAYVRISTTHDRSPSSSISGPLRTKTSVVPTEMTNIVWIESEPKNKTLLTVPNSMWSDSDEMEIVTKEGIRCQTVSGSQVSLQYGYPLEDGGMPFSILLTLNVVNVSNITGNILPINSNQIYWNDQWFTSPVDTVLSSTSVVPNIPNPSNFIGKSIVNGLLANTLYQATLVPFNALGYAKITNNNRTFCVTGPPQPPSAPIVNPSPLPYIVGGSINRLSSSSLTFTWLPPNNLGGIPRRQISYQLFVAYSTATNTSMNIPGIGIVNSNSNDNNITIRSYTVSTIDIPKGIENITFNRLISGTTVCLSVRAYHQGGLSGLSNPFTDPQQLFYINSNVVNITSSSVVTWSTNEFPWNNGTSLTVSNNNSYATFTTSLCALVLSSNARAPSVPSTPFLSSTVMNQIPIALSTVNLNTLISLPQNSFTDTLWISKYGTPYQRTTYLRFYSLWYPVLPYNLYFRQGLDTRLANLYSNLQQGFGSLYLDNSINNGTQICNDNRYMVINTTDFSRPTRTAGGWLFLSWLPSNDNGGTPITQYIIEHSFDRKVYEPSSNLIVSVPNGYDGTDMVSSVSVSPWGQNIRRYILETNNSLVTPSRSSLNSDGDQITDVTEWIENITAMNSYTGCTGSTVPGMYVTALVYELLADTTYFFRVTAISSVGVSSTSSLSAGIITGPGSRPGIAGDVRFSSLYSFMNRTSTNLPIEWKPPVDTGGVRVSSVSYSIYLMVREPNNVCGYGTNSTSYPWFLYTTVTNGVLNTTVNRLFGHTTYAIGLRTNSMYGGGPLMIASNSFTTTAVQLPLPPLSSNVQITLTSSGSLRFIFLPSNDDGGSQIQGYLVYIATNESLTLKNNNPDLVDWIQVANIPANIDTKRTLECGLVTNTVEDAPLRGFITSLLSSTTYIVRIAAYNSVGRGPLSTIDCRKENYRYPSVVGSMCPFGTTKLALPPSAPGKIYLSTNDEIRMALPQFMDSLSTVVNDTRAVDQYTGISSVSSSRIWLSWSPPTDSNGLDIVEYRIFISSSMDTVTIPFIIAVTNLPLNQSIILPLTRSLSNINVLEASFSRTSITGTGCVVYPDILANGCGTLGILPVQGLVPSTTYYARVVAINYAGHSRWSIVSNPFTTTSSSNVRTAASKVILPPIITTVSNSTYMQQCTEYESMEGIGSSLYIQIYPVWFHHDYDVLSYTIDYTWLMNPTVVNSITIAPDSLCRSKVRLETIYYLRIGNVRSQSLYNITVTSTSYNGKSNSSNSVTQLSSMASVPGTVFLPTILPSIGTYSIDSNNNANSLGTGLFIRWSGSPSNGGSTITGYSLLIRLTTLSNQSYTTVFTYNLNEIMMVNHSMYSIMINGTQLGTRWPVLCTNIVSYCNVSLPVGYYSVAISAVNSIGTGLYSNYVPNKNDIFFADNVAIVSINTACINFGYCNTTVGSQINYLNTFATIDAMVKNSTGGNEGSNLRTIFIAPNSVPITSGLVSLTNVLFNDYDDYTIIPSSKVPRNDEANTSIDLWYNSSSAWILTWRTGCTTLSVNGYCDTFFSLPNNPLSYFSPTIQYFVIHIYLLNSSSVPLRTVWISVKNTSSTLLRNNATVYVVKLDTVNLNGMDNRFGSSIGITVSACNSVGCGSFSKPLIVPLTLNGNPATSSTTLLPNPSSYCSSASRCTFMLPSLSILGNSVSHVFTGIYQECRTMNNCMLSSSSPYNFSFTPDTLIFGVKAYNQPSSSSALLDNVLFLSDLNTFLPGAYNRSSALAMVPKYGVMMKTLIPSDSTNGWLQWNIPSFNTNDVSPSVAVTGLEANTTYGISTGILFNNGKVMASILNNSNHVTFTTPISSSPLPPNSLFVLVPTATRLTIGWTVPVETGGVPIIAYVVQGRRIDTIGSDTIASNVSGTSLVTQYYGEFFIHTSTDTVKTWNIDNLLANTYYSFRILALNEIAYKATNNNLTLIQTLLNPLYDSSTTIGSTINTHPSTYITNGISGWSSWSEPFRTNFPTPPDPPTAPYIALTGFSSNLCLPGNSYTGCPSITSSSVSLSWLPLLATGGLPLIGYRVYITQGKLSPLAIPYTPLVNGKTSALPLSLVYQAINAGIVNPEISPLVELSMDIETRGTLYVDVGCSTNVTIIGLQPSTTYSFAVTAISAAGEGDASDPLMGITTLTATNPSSPGVPLLLSPDILTNSTGLSTSSSALVAVQLPSIFGARGLSHFEFTIETVGNLKRNTVHSFITNANSSIYQTVGGWNHEPVGRIRQWNVSAEDLIIGGDVINNLYQAVRLPLPENITNNFPSLSGLPLPIVLPGYHRFAALVVRQLSSSTAYRIAVSVINANNRRSVRSGWSNVFVTGSGTAPSSPLSIDIVKNSVTSSTMDMTITPPMDDGGAPIIGYVVHASLDGINWEDNRLLKDNTFRQGIFFNVNRTDPNYVQHQESLVSNTCSNTGSGLRGYPTLTAWNTGNFSLTIGNGIPLGTMRTPLPSIDTSNSVKIVPNATVLDNWYKGGIITDHNNNIVSLSDNSGNSGDGSFCGYITSSVLISTLAKSTNDNEFLGLFGTVTNGQCTHIRVRITGLLGDTRYFFRVQAVNMYNTSLSLESSIRINNVLTPLTDNVSPSLTNNTFETSSSSASSLWCSKGSWRRQFTVPSMAQSWLLQSLSNSWKGVTSVTVTASHTLTGPVKAPGAVNDLRIDNVITSMMSTSLTLSWLPPLDTGGQPVVCYRIDTASDGSLGNNIDMCDVPMTFMGYNSTTGYVTSLNPPPCSASNPRQPVFDPATIPSIGAWKANAQNWRLVGNSIPINVNSVPSYPSWFETNTGFSRSVLATYVAGDPYNVLNLPFTSVFNSTSRFSGSENDILAFSYNVCISSVMDMDKLVHSTSDTCSSYPPLVRLSSSSMDRITGTIMVPFNTLLRVRVVPITVELTAVPDNANYSSSGIATVVNNEIVNTSITAIPKSSLLSAISDSSVTIFRRQLQNEINNDGSKDDYRRLQALSSTYSNFIYTPTKDTYRATYSLSEELNAGIGSLLVLTPGLPPVTPIAPVLRIRTVTTVTIGFAAPPISITGCSVSSLYVWRSIWVTGDNRLAAWITNQVSLGNNVTNMSNLPVFSSGWSDPILVWIKDDDTDYPLSQRTDTTPLVSTFISTLQNWYPLQAVDGPLQRATSVRYTIQAGNKVGLSMQSNNLVTATLPTISSSPLQFRVVAPGVSPVSIPLAWNPPLDDGGRTITSYRIEVAVITSSNNLTNLAKLPYDGSVWSIMYSVTPPPPPVIIPILSPPYDITFTVSNLVPSQRYALRITAVTAVGIGNYSSLLEVRMMDPIPCTGLADPVYQTWLQLPSKANTTIVSDRGRCSGNGRCHPWAGTCTCDTGWGLPGCQFLDGHLFNITLTVATDSATGISSSSFASSIAGILTTALGMNNSSINASRILLFGIGMNASSISTNGLSRRRLGIMEDTKTSVGKSFLRSSTSGIVPYRSLQQQSPSSSIVNVPLQLMLRYSVNEVLYRSKLLSTINTSTTAVTPSMLTFPSNVTNNGTDPGANIIASMLVTLASQNSPLITSLGISSLTRLTSDQGVLPNPSPVNLLIPDCSRYDNCSSCLADTACGWCASASECILGNSYYPAGWTINADISQCAPLPGTSSSLALIMAASLPTPYLWYHSAGLQATCAPDCSSLSDCSTCTHRVDCGWCESTQTCIRDIDSIRGTACTLKTSNNVTVYGKVLQTDNFCPINICRTYTTRANCLRDPFCGYCDYGSTLTSVCASGNSFGFTDNLVAKCSAAYIFRNRTCSFSKFEIENCDTCLSKPGCGFCASTGVCGSMDINSGLPMLGKCPVANWYTKLNDGTVIPGTCPPKPLTPEEKCIAASKVQDVCISCLQESVSSGCALCSSPMTAGTPVCMLLGDALGSTTNGVSRQCTSSSLLRGIPNTNYTYGNLTLTLPVESGRGCTTSCIGGVPQLTAPSGTIVFGSALYGTTAVPQFYGVGERGPCTWLVSPLDLPNASTTTNPSYIAKQFALVTITFTAWDLANGDTIQVYDGVTIRTAQLLGTLTGRNLGPKGMVLSYTGTSGYLQVILRINTGGGLGFSFTWAGTNPSDSSNLLSLSGWYLGVVAIIATIVFGGIGWMIYRKIENWLLIRALARAPPPQEETLEMAQARAQRSGRGAPKLVINSFPVFEYDGDKLSELPLVFSLASSSPSASPPSVTKTIDDNGTEKDDEEKKKDTTDEKDTMDTTDTKTEPSSAVNDEVTKDKDTDTPTKDTFETIKQQTSDFSSPSCAICLTPFENGDICRILLCRHAYHRDCIDPSLLLNKNCPMCRRDATEMFAERLSLIEAGESDPIQFGPTVKIISNKGGEPKADSSGAVNRSLTGKRIASSRPTLTEEIDEMDFMTLGRLRAQAMAAATGNRTGTGRGSGSVLARLELNNDLRTNNNRQRTNPLSSNNVTIPDGNEEFQVHNPMRNRRLPPPPRRRSRSNAGDDNDNEEKDDNNDNEEKDDDKEEEDGDDENEEETKDTSDTEVSHRLYRGDNSSSDRTGPNRNNHHNRSSPFTNPFLPPPSTVTTPGSRGNNNSINSNDEHFEFTNPLPRIHSRSLTGNSRAINMNAVTDLMEMGFNRNQVIKALTQANGDVEIAADMLFTTGTTGGNDDARVSNQRSNNDNRNHADDDDDNEEEEEEDDDEEIRSRHYSSRPNPNIVRSSLITNNDNSTNNNGDTNNFQYTNPLTGGGGRDRINNSGSTVARNGGGSNGGGSTSRGRFW